MKKLMELSHEPHPIGEGRDVTCPRCGKVFRLYYNGGELDERTCCGLTHALIVAAVEYVVMGDPEPERSEE